METIAFRDINTQKHCSFVIKEEPFDLNTRWHYHEDIEIIFFQKGAVSGIMGNRFYTFNEGDLVLLGSNFPHVLFKSENHNYNEEIPSGLVVQFKKGFLGETFFKAPELKAINKLLFKSKNGLKFNIKQKDKCKLLLSGISSRQNIRQLFDLLEILNILSAEEDCEVLSLKNTHPQSALDESRMAIVRLYLQDNFKEDISVQEVADMVNMTVTSFCRYYKSRTLKHFKQTLNEIRISYACELLLKNNNVQEACYESGFNNPAYFSRTFKKIVGVNPSTYKSSTELNVVRW
ncbi:MAG: AraC family transcriptional regulator [Flavobacteriaceae bacterium]|nr:MAG: AraC family transcriptional regulator [Flavobacteriaceae bacterium]